MDAIPEDEGLWDELSHQQSREIQQHHARHHSSNHRRGPNLAAAVLPGLHRTADEFQRFTATVVDACTTAYHESVADTQRRRQYDILRRQNPATTYLEDFGIPKDYDVDPINDNLLLHNNDLVDEANHSNNNGGGAYTAMEQNSDFVEIPRLHRRPADAEGWGAAANLDLYFSSLYAYFYHRGLTPLVCDGIVQLLTLGLTLMLSIILFVYIDWTKLLTCIDESSCENDFLQDYIVQRPFSKRNTWTLVVSLYVLVFTAYGIFAVWSFVRQVREAWQAKWVYEERLGISAHRLEGGAVEWDRDVVDKLMQLQASGEYRVAIHGKDIDALTVANRILRKENFLVAMFNRGILDLSVPWVGDCLFCLSIELSLYFAILNYMFNHNFHVRPAFYLDPAALRRRFILCGVAHALFLPFLLFFSTLHFGLRHAYDWKAQEQYLGPRDWALSAKWKFREFNELSHVFERRLAPSYEAVENYLHLFAQKDIVTALGRILVFIGGSLGAVLVGFAAINDAILLHVKIADWNLLWYAGIFGVVYSAGKAMIPSGEARPRSVKNIYESMEDALANVATHTHYYPDIWRKRGWDRSTHAAVSSMYQFKAQLFLQEVLAALVAPYILCISLPRCAESICEFVLASKAELAGAGEVCGFATFDFDKFSDESWEGRTLGKTDTVVGSLSQSIMQTGDIEQATSKFPKPRARDGKMEKSFFNFKAAHPQWKCPESGQHLVDRVAEYQREETAALTREQQLYIEAAARQLETLARLEQDRRTAMSTMLPDVDDSHIPRTHMTDDDPVAPLVTRPLQSATEQSTLALSTFPQNQRSQVADALHATNLPRQPNGSSMYLGSRTALPNALGLSSELRRILNMSTLDGDVSVTASLLESDDDDGGRRAERQYLWLQRYHAHVAAQEGSNAQTASEPSPAGRTGAASGVASAVTEDVGNRLT